MQERILGRGTLDFEEYSAGVQLTLWAFTHDEPGRVAVSVAQGWVDIFVPGPHSQDARQEAVDVKNDQGWVVGVIARFLSLALGCLAVVSAFAPRAVAQEYLFNQLNLPADSNPRGVATADFNNDGRPDLAVVNQGSDNVSVLLGQASGIFEAATNYATGSGPYAIVAGDFNNDGNQDLAIANLFDNTVSILLGNGNGTFTLHSSPAVGQLPVALVAGDFNNDGKLDLAVTNMAGNSVSALSGKGDGTFQTQVVYPLASNAEPRAIVAGFFNSDNNLDLAVANNGTNNLSILLGSSSGTFTVQSTQPATGNEPIWIATADFNGDHIADLAVANNFDNTVSVLLGNGNGTFQTQTKSNVGSSPDYVWAGPLTSNGVADIVTANEGANTISVLIGTGAGTFQTHQDYNTGDFPYAMASADFNGDGVPDFAISNTLSNNVTVLIGDGDGTFSERKVTTTGLSGPDGVAVGSLKGDGNLDAAVANVSSNSVAVLFGNGDGTFTAGPSLTTGTGPSGVVIGDFNGDGIMDIATANEANSVSVMLGAGGGTFDSHVDYSTGNLGTVTVGVGLAAADVNLDGKLDLVATNSNANTVSVLLGNGDGTFKAHKDYAVGTTPVAVAIADFNGDGKPDLAVANSIGNTISVLLGTGTGSFSTQTPYIVGYDPLGIAVGDFNNDKIQDIATANSGGGSLAILLGNGDGTFQNHTNFGVPGANGLALGDFNGDGKLDAVLTSSSGTASVVLGNGNGTFMAHEDYTLGTKPSAVATGTFDTAGGLDFIATSFGSNAAAVFLNLPVIALYPTTFNFGTVNVGQMSSQNLTITNSSGTPLNISSLKTTGDFSDNAENCVASLLPGASCTAIITFSPTQAGMRTGTATVTDNSPSNPQVLSLTGTGQGGVSLTPTSLTFTGVAVGTTSAPQTLTLTNNGTTSITISSIVASPNPPFAYSSTTCGSSLGAGASCTISVTFTPQNTQLASGTLSVTDTGAGSPQTSSLSGTGLGPVASLSPTSLTFGDVVTGHTSPSQTVVLSNTGNATLNISSVTVSQQYGVQSQCGTTLSAGATCNILVAFRPTMIGLVTGTLTVTDNAPGSPQTASLTGYGTVVQLSPSSLNFGTVTVGQSSSPMNITLTNKGSNQSLSITGIISTDPTDFPETNNCPSSLGAGLSCTITVTFTPQTTGLLSAQIQVSDSGGGSPQTAALSGTGQ